MKKKLFTVGMGVVLMACVLTGCAGNENSNREKNYTQKIKNQFFDMHGLPQISNGYEYSQLKEIYELRDDPNLICYWYTKMITQENGYIKASVSDMGFRTVQA